MPDGSDDKAQALRRSGTLNARAQTVADPLFHAGEFFDPRDLLQVKYEMLRRVREEGASVAAAAGAFGFSRVAFYQIRGAWQREGVAGLLPRPRGPRRAHKLSGEVIQFIREALSADPALRAPALAQRVRKRFGISVHPRSIERALARRQKKGR